MEPNVLREKIPSGVISFPVTPFRPDYSLDLEGYRKNLEVLLQHPLAAIIAPGGTGEIFSLSPVEHLQIVQATVEVVGGKVPVLAGTGFNYQLSIELAREAERAGVDGILVFPPYYPNADWDGLFDYYAAVGKATKLGIIIYSRDWVNPGPAVVERLAEIPNLIAWKDGTGDIRRLQRIRQRVGDRLNWIGGAGDDLVAGYYGIGLRTYTSSIANVSPKLSFELHDAGSQGDAARLNQHMRDYVVPLYEMRTRRRGYEVSVMKEMMAQMGLAAGPCRPPLPYVTDAEKEEIRAMMKAWKPVL